MIAAYTTPASKAPYAPRVVHCIVLDAERAGILASHRWTVVATSVGVLATLGGGIAVRTTHRLVLYSSDFQPLAEFPLPFHLVGTDVWRVFPTPSGRALVVSHLTGAGATLLWLDSDTLEVTRTCDLPGENIEDWLSLTASSDSIARIDRGAVVTRGLEGPWRRVLLLSSTGNPLSAVARFLDDHTLLVTDSGRLTVIRDDGQVVLSQTLEKGESSSANEARVSANGRRAVIAVYRLKGGSEILDISPHAVLQRIAVLDLLSRRWVYELDAKETDLNYVWAFAISPDGSRLALVQRGAVAVYQLPE